MKKLFLPFLVLLGLQIQAQSTLCEQTYTTGNYYVFEVAIPTTANGLSNMAPLYAVTNTILDTWEDSCFGGPCTHTVYNEYGEDTITTCISYTISDSGYVDTLMCCLTQYWNGQSWVPVGGDVTSTWTCSQNAFGCTELMDGSGEFATEESCIASCDSIIYCNGYLENSDDNGQLTVSVYDMLLPVSYMWSTGETTQSISPSSSGVYYCDITDADGCDYATTFTYFDFDFCDSTWYDADFTEVDGLWEVTLTGYISENLNDLTDTVVHGFVITPSNEFMSQYGDVGSYPHSWAPEFALSLSTDDTLTVCWNSTIYADGLNAYPQGWSEMCNMNQEVCDEWVWDGEAWARSTSAPTSINEPFSVQSKNLIRVIDALGRIADKDATNRLLFYIYDNGEIEKNFIIE
ncbi:hypothetical protein N9E30_02050 [Flavobacteriales bacterium]|nr:hypothetical protein [Flavobacteriales bacterium]